MTKKTYTSVDALKFFFCICVIALHTHIFLAVSEEAEFYISRVLFRLAVPYFFVASGYFLGRKYKSTEKALHKQVLCSYLKRLLFPYVVFSLISISQYWAEERIVGHGKWGILKRIIQGIVFYPKGALWFVWAIIISAILMFPIMKHKNGVNICLVAGVVLFMFALICNNYYFVVENTPIASFVITYLKYCISARNGLFVGVVYVALGMKCYSIIHSKTHINKCFFISLTIVAFIIYIIEIVLLHINNAYWLDDGSLYITQLLLVPLLFLCSVLFSAKIPNTTSITLRNLSTGMYFLHRPILWFVSAYSVNVIVNFSLVTAIAFAICMISYKVKFKQKYYLLR